MNGPDGTPGATPDALRERAARAVAETAELLADPDGTRGADPERTGSTDPDAGAPAHAAVPQAPQAPQAPEAVPTSLHSGAPGAALLFAELARTDPRHRRTAHAWLARAGRERSAPRSSGLYDGPAALCFAVDRNAIAPGDYRSARDRLETACAAVADRLTAPPAHERAYDTVGGLAGIGGLLLARRSPAVHGVLRAVAELARPGVLDALVPPGPVIRDAAAPGTARRGHAGLGLGHGVAGPLALLSLAHREGVTVPGHAEAVDTLARWLLDRCRTAAAELGWPGGPGAPEPPIASWCNGVPGIARALHLAGDALGVTAWREEAVAALTAAVTSAAPTAHPVAAGLCHGWGGLLHVTALMAADSGDPVLTGRLPALAGRVLALRDPALPGAFRFDAAPRAARDEPLGFLTGAAGAALALHAFATATPSASGWERALLLA